MGMDSLSEREKKIRADLKAQFALKKECERRALDVVHRMLESPSVKEEDLKTAANSINPDFYHDIVVERGIAKLCGYPLCANELSTKMSRQKYHVSTMTNTVYDITERVNFCSNHCFKASKYYANQVPAEPLWTRDLDVPVRVSLLPRHSPSSATKSKSESVILVGNEVKMGVPLSGRTPTKTASTTTNDDVTCNVGESVGSSVQNLTSKDLKDEKNDVGQAVQDYQCLVAEAKLEMIKHLLFDGEKELKTTIEEKEEAKKMKGAEKEAGYFQLDGVESTGSRMTEKKEFPVILERNLEHGLSELKISGGDEAKISDGSDVKLEADIASGKDAHDDSITKDFRPIKDGVDYSREILSTHPFFDQIRIESEISQRLSAAQSVNSKRDIDEDRRDQGDKGKKVTFSDAIDYSDVRTSKDYEGRRSTAASRSTTSDQTPTSNTKPEATSRAASNGSSPKPSPAVHPLDPIWHALRSWTTRLTVMHLWSDRLDLGQQLEKKRLEEKVDDIVDRIDREEKRSEETERVVAITDKSRSKSPRKKPLPDFERLQAEQAVNEEKVVEFFKASFKLPTTVETVAEGNDRGLVVEKVEERIDRLSLPPTDRLSQVSIRRKLVLDRLLVVLPDILSTIQMDVIQVVDELKGIIETLHLKSDTIIFRPGQWAVIAVMLLKMASIRNGLIWDRLHRPKSCDILAMALDEIGIRLPDVDNLVAILTDPKTLQEDCAMKKDKI